MRALELLAPARNSEIAKAAILHGADAVYIGAEAFGARSAAGNSVEDIAELCEYAHRYRARVYVTINTIVYEQELSAVQQLIKRLYHAGVDALIVQDMSILEMDIPPIELHASTQCDTRTPAKARFLDKMGFSQIVLARELSIDEIKNICNEVKAKVEVFVHGALCVSYSGRCQASQVLCGRSANRGECAQICRMPYTLTDASGKVWAKNKHLLSLHDFNASASLLQLAEVGASSFKIEGRLKDAAYVKNITAYYRLLLDKIIADNPDKYCRSSYGRVELKFEPNPQKSFNRGFTDYFLTNRRPKNLASLDTPKSLGEPLSSLKDVHNGDGLAYFNERGEYEGFNVNGIKGNMPVPNRAVRFPKNVKFFRTADIHWQKLIERDDTAKRRIALNITLYPNRIEAEDERGCRVILPHKLPIQAAEKPFDPSSYFAKLGDTIYFLNNFNNCLEPNSFVPASALTSLRRELVTALDRAAKATHLHSYRLKEQPDACYPYENLDYRDNVANNLAAKVYSRHGVKHIQRAIETDKSKVQSGTVVMTTRHCPLRELGLCLKQNKKIGKPSPILPLTLTGAPKPLRLVPHCDVCECTIEII